MDSTELQASFFRQVKEKLPAHQSLVEVVAALLTMSNDSAYRRIRGEKTLSFDEIKTLAGHFHLSVDQLLHLDGPVYSFTGKFISRDRPDIENYLQDLISQLVQINAAGEKHMLYFNKDIPLFNHFLFPELAAFKCYFWSRYNLNYPEFNRGSFLISDFIDLFNKKGKEISSLYLSIPSTEIWNLDCINTTIRQIDYYRESKIFGSGEDIVTVYNCLDKLVDYLEKQVETGYKQDGVAYNVYVNEFILGDNTILVECDGEKAVYFNHNVINYIVTRQPAFVEYTASTLQTILQKSALISGTGEKTRQLFFDNLRERIHQRRKLV